MIKNIFLQNKKTLSPLETQFDPDQLLRKNLGLIIASLGEIGCQLSLNWGEGKNRKIKVISSTQQMFIVFLEFF